MAIVASFGVGVVFCSLAALVILPEGAVVWFGCLLLGWVGAGGSVLFGIYFFVRDPIDASWRWTAVLWGAVLGAVVLARFGDQVGGLAAVRLAGGSSCLKDDAHAVVESVAGSEESILGSGDGLPRSFCRLRPQGVRVRKTPAGGWVEVALKRSAGHTPFAYSIAIPLGDGWAGAQRGFVAWHLSEGVYLVCRDADDVW